MVSMPKKIDLLKIVKSREAELYKIISHSVFSDDLKILPETLLLAQDNKLSVYYAPFTGLGRQPLSTAKILLVGITPGISQALKAINSYKISNASSDMIRKSASFAGGMRESLVKYLDLLDLPIALGIKSSKALFETHTQLMLATSLIRFPTFYKTSNYTGHTPKIEKSDFLQMAIKSTFYESLEQLPKDVLIIPLGRAVESGLQLTLIDFENLERQVLWGFPHPSGLNAHAPMQFKENKRSMMAKIRKFY